MKEALTKGTPNKFVVAKKPNLREIAKFEASDP